MSEKILTCIVSFFHFFNLGTRLSKVVNDFLWLSVLLDQTLIHVLLYYVVGLRGQKRLYKANIGICCIFLQPFLWYH